MRVRVPVRVRVRVSVWPAHAPSEVVGPPTGSLRGSPCVVSLEGIWEMKVVGRAEMLAEMLAESLVTVAGMGVRMAESFVRP